MAEEATSNNKKSQEGKIPEGYVLETIFREQGKSFELWHDPKQNDLKLCYIKREVGNKW